MAPAAAALVYVAVTLLLFHNLLPTIGTDLGPDLGDPLLNTAILAWNAQHVPLTAEWWNFPSFAPLAGMTSLTEHLLLTYPLATPVIWMTGNPVLAYNLVLLLVLPLNGLSAWLLGRELTASTQAAFVAGLAFAFAPYQAVRLPHLQTLLQFGMPLALLGLHQYLRGGGHRALALFGVGWALTVLANGYTLAFFPILAILWCVWFIRLGEGGRLARILVVAGVATVPAVPLVLGYEAWHSTYGLGRTYGEARLFSADIASLAGISSREILWSRWLPTTYVEGSFFPVIKVDALAVIAVAHAIPRAGSRGTSWSRRLFLVAVAMIGLVVARIWTGPDAWRLGAIPLPPFQPYRVFTFAVVAFIAALFASSRFRAAWRSRDAWVFYAVAAGVLWLFALGPEPTWLGARALTYGPYRLLFSLPIADNLRVPARIWLPALVCLSMLAGGGLAVLVQRHPRRRRWIVAGATLCFLAEAWFVDVSERAPTPLREGLVPQGAFVLDLPLDNVVWNARAQYRAVMGRYRSVNGYSGYDPNRFDAFAQDVIARRDRAIDGLRRRETLYVLVATEQDPSLAPWIAGQPGAERLGRSGEFEVIRLPELR
jgi:hypothetical protein